MATQATSHHSYASLLKANPSQIKSIPTKPISYFHGEPIVQWGQAKVDQMMINENLQYAVVGKFSYG